MTRVMFRPVADAKDTEVYELSKPIAELASLWLREGKSPNDVLSALVTVLIGADAVIAADHGIPSRLPLILRRVAEQIEAGQMQPETTPHQVN